MENFQEAESRYEGLIKCKPVTKNLLNSKKKLEVEIK